MKRITAILAPLALLGVLLVGPWASAHLPLDEVTVVLAPGALTSIPETDIRVSYSEGSAMTRRGCIPYWEYGIVRRRSGSTTRELVGQQLGPWTVAEVREHHNKPGLLARLLGGPLGLEIAYGPTRVARLVRR